MTKFKALLEGTNEVADVANPLRISFRNGNLFQASKWMSL